MDPTDSDDNTDVSIETTARGRILSKMLLRKQGQLSSRGQGMYQENTDAICKQASIIIDQFASISVLAESNEVKVRKQKIKAEDERSESVSIEQLDKDISFLVNKIPVKKLANIRFLINKGALAMENVIIALIVMFANVNRESALCYNTNKVSLTKAQQLVQGYISKPGLIVQNLRKFTEHVQNQEIKNQSMRQVKQVLKKVSRAALRRQDKSLTITDLYDFLILAVQYFFEYKKISKQQKPNLRQISQNIYIDFNNKSQEMHFISLFDQATWDNKIEKVTSKSQIHLNIPQPVDTTPQKCNEQLSQSQTDISVNANASPNESLESIVNLMQPKKDKSKQRSISQSFIQRLNTRKALVHNHMQRKNRWHSKIESNIKGQI